MAELITFPPGALGLEPVRLPVVARGQDWLAVAKPGGVSVGPDVFSPGAPDLEAALQAAIAAGKPQLARLGITFAGRVHPVDTASSGVVVLALTRETQDFMRNAVGSCKWSFVYELVAQRVGEQTATEITCDLAVGIHATAPRAIVSRTTGKRCDTRFTPKQALGRWQLWHAQTRENRPHQVRLHAQECGLNIVGEYTYGRTPRVYLSQLKRGYRAPTRDERPLYRSLALHLREIELPERSGQLVRVAVEPPKGFQVVVRRLSEAAEGCRAS